MTVPFGNKFTIIATGKTFPIKAMLMTWGFYWDMKRHAWVRNGASQSEANYCDYQVNNGAWKEVNLEFIEEKK